MKTEKFNDEVIYSAEPVTKIDADFIDRLKSMAAANKRKRMRLCCHNEVGNALHEMLIVHMKGAYVQPHKHPNKSESFHMIEGVLKVVIFGDEGKVIEIINMGEYQSGKKFYYRLKENLYHTVIPLSDFVVFHETTNGPFIRNETKFADWAPAESDLSEVKVYLDNLEEKLNQITK